MNFEEFCAFIKSLDGNMSIGVHGVKEETLLNEPEIVEKVLSKGLELKSWGGILSSIRMFGQVKDLGTADLEEIYKYTYGVGRRGEIVNFLFGFPEVITNSQKEEYFLGHYINSSKGKDDPNAGLDLPLNALCDDERLVPREFIIGTIVFQDFLPRPTVTKNPNFYGELSPEMTQKFHDNLYDALQRKMSIANPKDMYENPDIYSKHGINVEETIGYQQYVAYLRQKQHKQ